MFLTIMIITTMLIWIGVSQETIKPSEKINWRKTILLMSTGSLLTLILIISLFQDSSFF